MTLTSLLLTSILLYLVAFYIERPLFEVQTERFAAEHRHISNDTLYLDVAARHRNSTSARDHRHLTRAVFNAIKLERHQRHAPGICDGAVERNRPVGVMAGVTL